MEDSNYTQIETVQKSSDAVIVRAVRRADGVPVLLKVVNDDGGAQPIRRLLKEREIGRIPDRSTILVPIDLAAIDGRQALVMADFAGHPLEDELDHAMGIEAALELAIRLATTLGELHARGIVHRDLKPQNVFVDPASGEIRLTGLGVALSSVGAYRPSSEPGLIEGTFAYMAPEQTGQTGRLVDQRADLYSLGVILYRMLTSKLPLEAEDALGWIYVHVAKEPPPVTSIVSGIPPMASAIVDKLLSKDPEERYQTTAGLVADLEQCLASWRAHGATEPFALGLRDVPDRLQIPRRRYGHDTEVRALTKAFESALAGTSKLIFLVGPAGIGKSFLAETLEAHVLSCGGTFLEGKHEELRRDVPYFAVAQALDQLACRLLTESEEKLAVWRARLHEVLGARAALLRTLVPRFAIILGEPAIAEQASPVASPDRFKLFFERLLEAVASAEHPLVLFLDDLQWADPATLGLLEQVLAHPEAKHVLTIGAYRELSGPHPLAAALARLRASGVATEIEIPPLSNGAIADLLVDAFRCSPSEATTLAELLRDRTGGNPLFVTDLLRTLHQQSLIRFDRYQAKWSWDVERIRRVPLAEGATELVLAKIGSVVPSVQQALHVGACLGTEFWASDVASAIDRPIVEVERDLVTGATQGLLLYSGNAFRFPHDRVREAAYSLLPPAERATLHLRIGRSLLARTEGTEREAKDFIIADQLNRAASLMTTVGDRNELAVLDLAVGRKAKMASAYASAAQYFASGMAVLDADAWEHAYVTTYALHLERAACELVVGGFEQAERLLGIVLEKAHTPAERAAAYALLVDLRMTQGDVAMAVKLGLDGIHACGVDLPDWTIREETERAVIETWSLLGDTPIETLAGLPRATDSTARAVTDLMAHVGTPIFYIDERLFAMLVSRSLALTLRWGVSEGSPTVFAGFSLVFEALTERYADAWKLGRAAYEMAQRPGLSVQKPTVCVIFASLINYWRHHVRTNLPYLEEALEAALQVGDLTYLCYAENHLVMTRLIMGGNLADLEAESEQRMKRVRAYGFDEMADLMLSRHLLIQCLQGKTHALGSFSTPELDERELDERLRTTRAPLTRCWHYIDQLQAAFFAGQFERAVTAGRAAASLLHTSTMFPVIGEHAFYFALALASAERAPDATAVAEEEALLDGCHERLRRWAESCPANFSSKHALVSAEVARLRGNDLEAMRDYERAICGAQDNGFVHVQAIAYELAARFYQVRGFSQFADTYLREARRCFSLWGATEKVRWLEQPDQRFAERSNGVETVATETVATRPEELNLLTVTRASQALSAELVRARLLDRLLGVMLPYSGARRCCFVAAEGEHCPAETELPARSPAHSGGLPQTVINYVRRTREPVLLHDASAPNPFSSDHYLRSCRPRSVLCLPLARKDRVLGLIYLENDLVPGVFSRERVTVLEILAAEAAISLESAALVADLERENAQRRQIELSLRESREQLQAILENMVDAVVVCDDGGRVTLVNQAAVSLFGLADREVIPAVGELEWSLRMRHLDGRPFARTELPLVRALAGEVVPSVEATFTSRQERDLELRTSAAPIRDEAGIVVGAVAAASDVTEKVELDRLRDQFLRMAAHELKTPVAVMSGYAELLQTRREQLPLREQRMLDALVRGARKIDQIVSDLLFMWQLRMGRLVLVEEKVDLGTLLSRVATRCEPPPQPPRVRLSVVDPVTVVGDRLLLEQVFTHLIDNALRYSPAGGPIEMSLKAIAPDLVEVSVSDHGVGIAKSKQARIFEPFYRAHAETAYDFGGMGAGLYLSKVIVGRHSGTIRFDSRENEGSTFTVRLPSEPRDCAAPP